MSLTTRLTWSMPDHFVHSHVAIFVGNGLVVTLGQDVAGPLDRSRILDLRRHIGTVLGGRTGIAWRRTPLRSVDR